MPRYFIVGARPVALLPTEEGGLECVALNWDTGELEPHVEYLTRVSLPDGEVDVVTREEFDEAVGRDNLFRLLKRRFRKRRKY